MPRRQEGIGGEEQLPLAEAEAIVANINNPDLRVNDAGNFVIDQEEIPARRTYPGPEEDVDAETYLRRKLSF